MKGLTQPCTNTYISTRAGGKLMSNERLKEVENMVRQLRPVLGDKVDRHVDWWVWSDREGREQIERSLMLELRKHFPNSDALVLPPPDKKSSEGLVLGTIMHDTKPAGEFVLPAQDLLKHTLITGATGAGKTTLIFQLVRQLLQTGVPFALFDFKLDYRPLLGMNPTVRLYTVGQPTAPLAFNPLVELAKPLIQARSVRDWSPVFLLSDVLCRVFYAGHGVRSLLNKAFVHIVQDWAAHDQDPEYTPTFQLALKWLRDYEGAEKGMRIREWKISTVRILEALSMGEYGRQANVTSDKHVPYTELRKHPTVFELNLPEDLKNCFVETLLLCGRQASIEGLKEHERGVLRQVLIIDESHNLLREYPGLGESQLQLALREHRGLGTAYVLADQTPSQLDKTAFANTHLKMFFALLDRSDILAAKNALLLDRDHEEHLSRLPIGTCVARYGTSRPFVVRVPPADDVMKHVVTDAQVREASLRFSGLSSTESEPRAATKPSEGSDKKEVGDAEKRLLEDILVEPFAGVQKHYDNLRVSSRNGHKIKEGLEAKGLVKPHEVTIAEGGTKIVLEITKPGVELLQELGHTCHHPYFANGAEHEATKDRIAQSLKSQGFEVTKERRLHAGTVDVYAERADERIAIEVETGKSNIQANLDKLEKTNITRAISVPTNSRAREKLTALSPAHSKIAILNPADFELSPPPSFWSLSGPEKLLLLEAVEHPDQGVRLPAPPPTPPRYWQEACETLEHARLVTTTKGRVSPTWRGRQALEAVGITWWHVQPTERRDNGITRGEDSSVDLPHLAPPR